MFAANAGQSVPIGTYWRISNLTAQTQWLSSVVPSSSMIVVGGRGGPSGNHVMAYTTNSGQTWTSASGLQTLYNNTCGFMCIAYGASAPAPYLVASTGPKIATASNVAGTWTDQPQISTIGWGGALPRAAVWDVNQWLLVGDSGSVATSPDGVTWTNQPGLASTAWGTASVFGIVTNFAGFRYLVYGASGKIATSPDGVTWTNRTGLSSTAWGTNSVLVGMYNGSVSSPLLVVAGSAGAAATTTDGITWTYQSGFSASGMTSGSCGTYTGDGFIVGTINGPTAYSPNGVVWQYSPALIPAWTWPGFPNVAMSSMVRQGRQVFAFGNTQFGQYGVTS